MRSWKAHGRQAGQGLGRRLQPRSLLQLPLLQKQMPSLFFLCLDFFVFATKRKESGARYLAADSASKVALRRPPRNT